MNTINDFTTMLNAKRTVSDFFYDINKYHYNHDFDELSYSRAKKNYERILKRLYEIKLPDPKLFKYTSLTLQELLETLQSLMTKILGQDYKDEIESLSKLVKTYKNDDYFDSVIEEAPKGKIMTPINVYISNHLYNIQVASTGHEYIHGLMSKYKGENFNNHISNIHYNELLSILIEYILCYELSELLKDKTLIDKHEVIRASHAHAQSKELLDIRALSAAIHKSPSTETEFYKLYSEYQEHNAYTYILDDMYSIHLMEYYLEDKETLIKLIKAILNGEKSLIEIINYYGISLRNNDTIRLYNEQIERTLKYPRQGV